MNPYLFEAESVPAVASVVNSSSDSYRQAKRETPEQKGRLKFQDLLEDITVRMGQHRTRLEMQRAVLKEEHRAMQQQAACRLRECLESALAPLEAHISSLGKMQEAATMLLSKNSVLHDEEQFLSLVRGFVKIEWAET